MNPNLSPPDAGDPNDSNQPSTRAMRQALSRLLDQVNGSREVLAPLAALERILKTYGLASLDRMPLSVLNRIVAQLSGLPVRADDRPLRTLLALLASTLERRLLDVGGDTAPAPFALTIDSEARLAGSDPRRSPFPAAVDPTHGPTFQPALPPTSQPR